MSQKAAEFRTKEMEVQTKLKEMSSQGELIQECQLQIEILKHELNNQCEINANIQF
jgi:hypothetical protein